MFTSSAFSLPFFAPLAVYLPLLLAVKLGKFNNGIKHLCFWFFIFFLCIFTHTLYDPQIVQQTVIASGKYTNDKFKWIKSGDNNILNETFLSYISQYFLICISSLASGGLIGLMIISRDISKLGFYSGSLNMYSDEPIVAFFMSLECWNVIKIIGLLFGVMAFSSFFLYWIMDFELEKRKIIKYFVLGLLLTISAYFIKLTLISPTQRIIKQITVNLPTTELPGEGESTDIKFY